MSAKPTTAAQEISPGAVLDEFFRRLEAHDNARDYRALDNISARMAATLPPIEYVEQVVALAKREGCAVSLNGGAVICSPGVSEILTGARIGGLPG